MHHPAHALTHRGCCYLRLINVVAGGFMHDAGIGTASASAPGATQAISRSRRRTSGCTPMRCDQFTSTPTTPPRGSMGTNSWSRSLAADARAQPGILLT